MDMGWNTLHVAVNFAHLDGVKAILRCPLGPSLIAEQDENGNTPLHFVFMAKRQELCARILEVLLDTKEGKEATKTTNSEGRNIMHLAAGDRNSATMEMMLKTKARIIANGAGKNPPCPYNFTILVSFLLSKSILHKFLLSLVPPFLATYIAMHLFIGRR